MTAPQFNYVGPDGKDCGYTRTSLQSAIHRAQTFEVGSVYNRDRAWVDIVLADQDVKLARVWANGVVEYEDVCICAGTAPDSFGNSDRVDDPNCPVHS